MKYFTDSLGNLLGFSLKGCIVTAYGLTVLGREFEGAQKVVEGTKEKLEGGLDAWAKEWGKEDDHDDVKETDTTRQTTSNVEVTLEKDDDDNSLEKSCNKEAEGAKGGNSSVEDDFFMNEAHKALLEKQLEQKAEKQSPLDDWGKAWNSKTRSFRKGTSSFISSKLLPALRELDLTNKKKREISSDSISEDAAVVQLSKDEKSELSKALGGIDLKHKKENAAMAGSFEEDAVIVQIGEKEGEKIMLSKEEIEMIQDTIDDKASANEFLVPEYAESLVSDSSQSNGGDTERVTWSRIS